MRTVAYLALLVSAATFAVAVLVWREVRRLSGDLERHTRAVGGELSRALKPLIRQTRRQHLLTRSTIDAVVALSAIPTDGVPPPSGQGWSASPMVQRRLAEVIMDRSPDLVVELGGGSSSVLVARLLKAQGHGRLISIDHDPAYAEVTRQHLRRHGLESFVEIRIAPLTEAQTGTETWRWYHLAAFEDLRDIDVLFVDGPPGVGRKLARYPAVPLLLDRLADGVDIVLDDAARRDERAMIERWTAESGVSLITAEQVGTGWAHLRGPKIRG